MKSDSFVSTLIVLDGPLAAYEESLMRIQGALDSHYSDYEVVIVGQGTAVDYLQQNEAVLQKIPSLRYIQLASRVHPDVAWAAALENAIGDFVVMFDPVADPVDAISESVAICKSGCDVVVGVARQPRTRAYRVFRLVADSILKQIDYVLPRNATSLRCMSRRAVNSVTSTGPFHHQLSMKIQKTGYPQNAYSYTLRNTDTALSRSLLSGIRDLLRLIVFNSSRPLRWMSWIGLLGSVAAFIFASYSLLIHLVKGRVAEGWTTMILFMSIMFMLQFVMMAFFGEYLGRLLNDRSEQADYSVVFEKNSAVMINRDRVNVLPVSTPVDDHQVKTGRSR